MLSEHVNETCLKEGECMRKADVIVIDIIGMNADIAIHRQLNKS